MKRTHIGLGLLLWLLVGCDLKPAEPPAPEAPVPPTQASTTTAPAVVPDAQGLPPGEKSPPPPVVATLEQKMQAARDAHALGWSLYQELAREPGNVALSPFGLSTALVMTSIGARSSTLDAMRKALHLSLEGDTLHAAYQALREELEPGFDTYVLEMGSRLWLPRGTSVAEDFRYPLQAHYGAGLAALDWSQPESAVANINGWVAQQTRGRIMKLLPNTALSGDERLVLTQALFFEAPWARSFDAKATEKAPFASSQGRVEVDMMHAHARFYYGEVPGAQLLTLPFEGKRMEMVVVLPRERTGLLEVEKQLSPEKLAAWMQQMRERPVQVWLPRVSLSSTHTLSQALGALGMAEAFGGGADFSGMLNGKEPLRLSEVHHQVFFEVDEKGARAAGATAVRVAKNGHGPKHPEFRADRPFVFLIRDVTTGNVLLLGRVSKP